MSYWSKSSLPTSVLLPVKLASCDVDHSRRIAHEEVGGHFSIELRVWRIKPERAPPTATVVFIVRKDFQ